MDRGPRKLAFIEASASCFRNWLSKSSEFLEFITVISWSSRAISGVMFRVQTRYNWVTSLLLQKDGEVEIWCRLQDQFAMRHRTSYESTPFLGRDDESALTIIWKWKSDTCATSKWKAPPVDEWWNDCLLSLPCLRKSPALHLMVSRSLFHGIVDPWCITNILWMTNNPSDLKHNSAGDSRWTMLRKTREDLHARRDWASLRI